MAKQIETLDRHFQSGNSVPIDEATIPREEWEAVKAYVAKLEDLRKPVAWALEDVEASAHYGKDIYVYYGKADFADGVNPTDIFKTLIPLCVAPQTPSQPLEQNIHD